MNKVKYAGEVDTVEPGDAGGVAAADVVGEVAPEPTVRVLRRSRWLADASVLATRGLYL
ncbi:MAG: hypothetical protein IVW55_16680 [Chloroflexi bacterium]|nr:hypothetical protein [Chloroflexota bacterium]